MTLEPLHTDLESGPQIQVVELYELCNIVTSRCRPVNAVDITAHVYFSPLSVDSRPIGRPTRSQPTVDRLSADRGLKYTWISLVEPICISRVVLSRTRNARFFRGNLECQ